MNVENTTYSVKIPEFKKCRKGTEVFILVGEERFSVYDNYSAYPDADATKWRVNVYNKENGDFYDKICTSGGLYFTRQRALEEIDRFKTRGNDLIFYVMPINFTYDRVKFIWPEQTEYPEGAYVLADLLELREEACKRVWCMKGRYSSKIPYDPDYRFEDCFASVVEDFNEAQKGSEYKAFPYSVTYFYNDNIVVILCISKNKADWQMERSGLAKPCGEYNGYTPAYCMGGNDPKKSGFKKIYYKFRNCETEFEWDFVDKDD